MILSKSPAQIEKMRMAGRLTAQVLEALDGFIQPGITTMDIDTFCEDYIVNTLRSIPGDVGQYGYPYSVNTSLNHEICHGAPSATKVLKSGDIVNVDITIVHEGHYGDSSRMFCIGKVAKHAQDLVTITQQCLYDAIAIVRPGATVGDIGYAIQQRAHANNYSVVKEYCGHGVGMRMHESPQIPHFGKPGTGEVLIEGMTFTIEPMINQGKAEIRHVNKIVKKCVGIEPVIYENEQRSKLIKKYNGEMLDWPVAITRDKKLSAQWEHTILVTADGCDVLTQRRDETFDVVV